MQGDPAPGAGGAGASIEDIHDGSSFTHNAKLRVFLPSALVLLALWGTGLYLWWLPHGLRRRKRRRARVAGDQ